jgi:hypothetical protein
LRMRKLCSGFPVPSMTRHRRASCTTASGRHHGLKLRPHGGPLGLRQVAVGVHAGPFVADAPPGLNSGQTGGRPPAVERVRLSCSSTLASVRASPQSPPPRSA